MKYPYISIDLDKIEDNCRIITNLCKDRGINVAGVTKVTCGMPKVARAMLRGGVKQIADSRLENIRRMKNDGINADFLLLRIPMLSEVSSVVDLADISLNSEIKTIKGLSDAALSINNKHKIILMIDVGDLREGILPAETFGYVEQILSFNGVELEGIGTNLACFGGIQPTDTNLSLLVSLAEEIRDHFNIPLPIISGGNTFTLPLLEKNDIPEGINHLRLGASILLAAAPTPEKLYAMLHKDAFLLHGEIIELKDKPSIPYGVSGEDAFGNTPVFDTSGKTMKRAILGLGREDVTPEWLFPLNENIKILGASSDHLILDVTDSEEQLAIGSEVIFNLDYGALLGVMTSPYVEKFPHLKTSSKNEGNNLVFICCPPSDKQYVENLKLSGLSEAITDNGYEIREAKGGSYLIETEISFFTGDFRFLRNSIEMLYHRRSETGLICFDSNGDFISDLLNSGKGKEKSINRENMVLLGVRNLTPEQKTLLDNTSVKIFTIKDIDRAGIGTIINQAINSAGLASRGIHIAINLSVADKSLCPGIDNSEIGGLQFREMHYAMELIAECGLLSSISLSRIDQIKDISGKSVDFAIGLIASLLGRGITK